MATACGEALKVIVILENGTNLKLTDMESMCGLTEIDMKVCGNNA